MIQRQHLLAERHQEELKRERTRLNLEESMMLRERNNRVKAAEVLTKEAALNIEIPGCDLKPFSLAINLEGNPVKRVGQHALVAMHKF